MRIRRQPRDLDGGLADLIRLRQPPLHLERVAPQQHERNEQPSLARRTGDRDAVLRVRDRLVVVLEVVLGPAEVVEGLESVRQLGVIHALDLRERLRAVLARRLDPAAAASPSVSADAATAISPWSPSPRAVRSAASPISNVCSKSFS